MRRFLMFVLALLMVTCTSDDDVAGTVDETETGVPTAGIYGHVVDAGGAGIDSVKVRLYEADSIALLGLGKQLNRQSLPLDSTLTDSTGRYLFGTVGAGTYNLQAELILGADTLTAFRFGIVHRTLTYVGADTLRTPGSIRGQVHLSGGSGSMGATVYIPGTSYMALSDSTGNFTISSVPPGTCMVAFSAPGYVLHVDSGVVVRPGEETVLSLVRLVIDPDAPPPSPSGVRATYDTLTGVVYLSWSSVQFPVSVGYVVFHKDSTLSAAEPEQISGLRLVMDTVYCDTVSDSLADAGAVLMYQVKSQDERSNRSTVYSAPVYVALERTARPRHPSPVDGATGQPLSLTLSWMPVAAATSDTVRYRVCLDTLGDPHRVVLSGADSAQAAVAGLLDSTAYYWRVRAIVNGRAVDGPVWSFTTRAAPATNHSPTAPSRPSVSDGDSLITAPSALAWSATDEDIGDTLWHYVYFDTQPAPATRIYAGADTSASAPPAMVAGKTYYWQVVVSDGKASTAGPVWRFTLLDTNAAPFFTHDSSAMRSMVEVGVEYRDTVHASDPNPMDSVRFSVTRGPVTIDSITGVITWFPSEAGNYSLTVRAQDADGAHDELSWTITVLDTTARVGLVAHWDFDDTGTALTDRSGNGNHGTVHGATPAAGLSGGALRFDGVDDYVEVAHPAAFDFASRFSISLWLRVDDIQAGANQICDKGEQAYGTGYGVFFADTTITARHNLHVETNEAALTRAELLGGFLHVVWVVDADSQRLYIDGVVRDRRVTAISPVAASIHPLVLGKAVDRDCYLRGDLEEMRVYDYALSPQEVDALWQHLRDSVPRPTLQDSVRIARDGDTLVLGPDTVRQSISVAAKRLTIKGDRAGTLTPWKLTDQTLRCVTIGAGASVVLEGFLFEGNKAGEHGGGVVVDGAHDTLVIRGCVFRDNYSHRGPVLRTLTGASGGAVIIENTIMHDNRANDGGVVYIHVPMHVTIHNNLIYNNSAIDYCGAIWLRDQFRSQLTFTKNVVAGNTAARAAGLETFSGEGPVVNSCVVVDNTPSNMASAYSSTFSITSGAATTCFVNPAEGDFRLRPGTSAINGGDPDLPRDSDNTTADMGCYLDRLPSEP